MDIINQVKVITKKNHVGVKVRERGIAKLYQLYH